MSNIWLVKERMVSKDWEERENTELEKKERERKTYKEYGENKSNREL